MGVLDCANCTFDTLKMFAKCQVSQFTTLATHYAGSRDADLDSPYDQRARRPFFVFWAPHLVHAPLQAPPEYLARFSFIDDWRRRRYSAMVSLLDDEIGRVVHALRETYASSAWHKASSPESAVRR